MTDFVDLTIQSQADFDSILDGFLIRDWESSRKTQADGAGLGIGNFAKVVGWTAAEHLGFCRQLDVDLEADDGGNIVSHIWGI